MPSHSPHHLNRCNRRSTPFCNYQEHIKIFPVLFTTDHQETQNSCPQEGTLLTKQVSNGQIAFYTQLHLTTKTSTKHLTVKIDPGTQVNTILLSRYSKTLPKKMPENGYPKPSSLNSTNHFWISHDGKQNPFLGQFITNVKHVSQAMSYLTCFYVFEDATSPHILL